MAFLKALRRQLRGPFTVVWDRHGIHNKSRLVQAFLAEHPEVVAEDFPGHVPDLNPDESVWGWTKYGHLSNLAAIHAAELRDYIIEALVSWTSNRGCCRPSSNMPAYRWRHKDVFVDAGLSNCLAHKPSDPKRAGRRLLGHR